MQRTLPTKPNTAPPCIGTFARTAAALNLHIPDGTSLFVPYPVQINMLPLPQVIKNAKCSASNR